MASFTDLDGGKILVRVRRKGHTEQSMVFDKGKKKDARDWAERIEQQIKASRAGVLPSGKGATTVGQLVRRYRDEIGPLKPFGRNKADVLGRIEWFLNDVDVRDLTADRIVSYITADRAIHGTTAAIDLTYLKGVLRVARALWKIPVVPGVVDDARDMLKYLGQLNRSNERDRRPTQAEIDGIKDWLAPRSETLTPDHIDFTLDSCFRPPSEIVRLRWADLNHTDRTIVIHDRKDPRKKLGNHQTVPLLGRCYEIIMRQPQIDDCIFPVNGKSWSSIFPRACHALKIHDLNLYDLRHEAASRLVESGKYSIPELMLIGGWKDPKQLMRYTQLKARNLHR